MKFPQLEMTEYLEPLHHVAREVVELEATNKAFYYEYYDEDVMAAVLVFNHVLANRKIHFHNKINKPMDQSTAELKLYGEQLRALVEYMTGIDTQTYYKDKGRNKEKDNGKQ